MTKFSAAKQSDTLVLTCYDIVGDDMWGNGITAASVSAKLAEAGTFSRIEMRISSPGGDPFQALAIKNLLQSKGVPINVHIDGLAASAASLLAMAGTTISMGEGSMVMIHEASAICFGNAADMTKMAATLEQVSGNMADVYAARTKLSKDEITAMMAAETWMDANQALAKGFADSITASDVNAPVAASFDLKRFRNTPSALIKAHEQYSGEEFKRLELQLA